MNTHYLFLFTHFRKNCSGIIEGLNFFRTPRLNSSDNCTAASLVFLMVNFTNILACGILLQVFKRILAVSMFFCCTEDLLHTYAVSSSATVGTCPSFKIFLVKSKTSTSVAISALPKQDELLYFLPAPFVAHLLHYLPSTFCDTWCQLLLHPRNQSQKAI